MLEFLNHIDTELFLILNPIGHPYLDNIMWLISKTNFWIPYYLILAIFIILKFKKQSIIILLSIALTIVLSDRISSGLIKKMKRPRPTHEMTLEGKILTVNNYKGGKYGFVSSHAANSFALAFFISLIFRRKWISLSIFFWAIIVSYSRIYLGVHYPADIIGGAIVGILCAFISYILYQIIENFIAKRKQDTQKNIFINNK